MYRLLIGLAVAACIIVAGVVLFRNRHQLFRPDVHKRGGTLLVFAVEGEPAAEDVVQAAEVLQRRFDPTGGLGIEVRAAENNAQIEIAVPAGPGHDDLVERIKQVAPQRGQLEFRMVANSFDDEPAIKAARAVRVKGAGPPPPLRGETGAPEFITTMPDRSRHRYSWARMSEDCLQSLGIDTAGGPGRDPVVAAAIAQSLANGTPFDLTPLWGGLAVAVKVEGGKPALWMLTREYGEDQQINSGHVTHTRVEKTDVHRRRPVSHVVINITLNAEGGSRLHSLTSRNAVDFSRGGGEQRRTMAVLVNDEVVSAPAIHAAIRRNAQISGEYDAETAERLGCLIRGGALPVKLNPKPVRESTIEPKK